MKIHKLVIPTPFYIGPINIYLIDDDPLTLIDTGPRTDEALSALRQQMLATGHRVDDIKRVILTHTHEDHCGLAGKIQQISAPASTFMSGKATDCQRPLTLSRSNEYLSVGEFRRTSSFSLRLVLRKSPRFRMQ